MSIKESLLNLLFPNDMVCWACGREAVLDADCLCAECRGGIARAPLGIACPPALDGLYAGLLYNESVQAAMHRYKYNRQTWLAPFFASYMELPPDWQIDCFVPVPLHPLREWQRTYNQSALLCRALTQRYPVPIRKDLIRRARYTRQQAKLPAEARKANISGAFKASTAAAGLSIVLIDDVTTTCSTLNECATALRHAGASRVYAACACVAGYDRNP